MKRLSCVMLNYNTADMTARALAAFLEAARQYDAEVILIDNGSKEAMSDPRNERVVFIRNERNLGFAAAVNQGIKRASGEAVLLLNSDVIIDKTALAALLEYSAAHPEVGIMGPGMVFPDGSFQESAGWFPSLAGEFWRFSRLGRIFHAGMLIYPQNYSAADFSQPIKAEWVSGGCMLLTRALIEKIGLLDEAFFFSVEDIDYCLRARQAGLAVAYLPFLSVIHHHGFSSGGHSSVFSARQEKKSMAYFLKKHEYSPLLRLFSGACYSFKIGALRLRDLVRPSV